MVALVRHGAIWKGCQVPPLGLRPQNGTDEKDVASAKSLRSGATTVLDNYPLGPLDRRKKLGESKN